MRIEKNQGTFFRMIPERTWNIIFVCLTSQIGTTPPLEISLCKILRLIQWRPDQITHSTTLYDLHSFHSFGQGEWDSTYNALHSTSMGFTQRTQQTLNQQVNHHLTQPPDQIMAIELMYGKLSIKHALLKVQRGKFPFYSPSFPSI